MSRAATVRYGQVADSRRLEAEVTASFILPVGRRLEPVRLTVASLVRSAPGRIEIILVTARQSRALSAYIAALAERSSVRLLPLASSRLSVGRAWDLGARAARGERLFFVRSGARLRSTSQWLASLAALDDPRVGLVGIAAAPSPSRSGRGAPRVVSGGYRFTLGPLGDSFTGVRATAFWEVGGLATRRGHQPVADLQWRLVRANYRLAVVNGSPTARRLRDGRFSGHRYPVLSVAIATRNYGRWLSRCLASILRCPNPTRAPVQIVVADDASTDETARVLEAWKRRYPRNLTLVTIRTSRGVAAAKNDAIRRAIGKYIALHDADDEFRPAKLVRCYAAFRAPSRPDLVTHDYRYVEDDTGRTEVPGPDWCGGWRPPGVWVFRSGTVTFNEQMVSGYEELEWSMRRWRRTRRVHVAEVLSTVHGTSVADRWKFERQIAGAASMTRWTEAARAGAARAFACRRCGNQYLRPIVCCGRRTEAVPLVCYMVAASGPQTSPVALSVILAVGADLSRARRVMAALASTPAGSAAEWIFVHCHPRPDLLRYLAAQSQAVRVKAILTPPGHPLVYSHDVNRGARAALGQDLVVVSAQERTTAWSIQREAFWALGALPERALGGQTTLAGLVTRATAAGYRTMTAAGQLPDGALGSVAVSVAVVVHNNAAGAIRSLRSLARLHRRRRAWRLQVVVVDNGSTDGTRLALERGRRGFPWPLIVVHGDRVQAPAAAWNTATDRCLGRYVVWLRPGDRLTPGQVAEGVRRLQADPGHLLARAGRRGPWLFLRGIVRLNEQVVLGDPWREWLWARPTRPPPRSTRG